MCNVVTYLHIWQWKCNYRTLIIFIKKYNLSAPRLLEYFTDLQISPYLICLLLTLCHTGAMQVKHVFSWEIHGLVQCKKINSNILNCVFWKPPSYLPSFIFSCIWVISCKAVILRELIFLQQLSIKDEYIVIYEGAVDRIICFVPCQTKITVDSSL